MSLFGTPVPTSKLGPRAFALLPTGRYRGRLDKVELRTNDDGWHAISTEWTVLATIDGEATFKQGEDEYAISRTRRFMVTTQPGGSTAKAEQQMEIAQEQMAQLFHALGIAEYTDVENPETGETEQAVDLSSFETEDDLLEALQDAYGSEAGLYIKQEPRQRKIGGQRQIVQRDDGSGPMIDDNIKAVFALDE